ncbi:MAG: hypothetical protein F6K54_28225 [Okeania sp. SIO3B5]|uniref:hypothetical protein n=1 Tax=Okeania sp. SIO3B5 TaxID=2607811 RepID=UPI0013FE68DF|nr:hypothetical protein [Okeania sp. SIO3B5]NEO56620.1 hypothetical protein [Okeania sp. SIO3B5]
MGWKHSDIILSKVDICLIETVRGSSRRTNFSSITEAIALLVRERSDRFLLITEMAQKCYNIY